MLREHLRLATSIVFCISLIQLPPCNSADLPTEAEVPVLLEVTGAVSASGGHLTSAKGKLSIEIPPSAIASDAVVSNITAPLPQGCTGAKYAVFLPGKKIHIIIACQGGSIGFIKSTLVYS